MNCIVVLQVPCHPPSGILKSFPLSATRKNLKQCKKIDLLPPISAKSIPSPVEVPSSNSLAAIRDRYQATGLSKEVVDILLASWGTATHKRYSGPWKAWIRWCSQRGSCPFSASVAEVLAFLASLVTQGNLEYRTIAL